MNGDGDERYAKSEIRIAEIDEAAARRVNPDQNRIEIEGGINALPSFSLMRRRGEMKGGSTMPKT